MKLSCLLDEAGKLKAVAAEGFSCGKGAKELDMPDDYDNTLLWCHRNGEWIKLPPPALPEVHSVQEEINKLTERNEALEAAILELSDQVYGTSS